MSLKAGRVGVNPKEVDGNGNLKESSNSYSKAESDGKFETKANIGGLQFRVESVSGTAQYKTPEGDWVNFNSGSGGVGFNIPDDATPITQSMVSTNSSRINILEGSKYYIDNKTLYVDISLKRVSGTSDTEIIILIPVGEQANYNYIGDVHVASMCVDGNNTLTNNIMMMHDSSTVAVKFTISGGAYTYRLYGQITLK